MAPLEDVVKRAVADAAGSVALFMVAEAGAGAQNGMGSWFGMRRPP